MAQISIEIDADTAAALAAQAEAKGMTLDGYLRTVAATPPAGISNDDSSPAQFERGLDDLLADMPDLPVLHSAFSRADIYGDHN